MNRVRDAFSRWSRMGNNDNDEAGMSEQETTQEVNTAQDGVHVDLEAGTESGGQAVEQLVQERDALKDRLARLQAEFDNSRKREIKERQDARDYATQNAIEPFLNVMDNFALALKAQGSVEQLRSGVELIVKQMDEALRGLQVQPVESVGAQFDPRVHEALGSIETKEHPDHQVLEEIRRGYKLRDKLLRPALVRIAENPSQISE